MNDVQSMTTAERVAAGLPSGLRLGAEQERRLRRWPKDRIRPKSVALGVISLLAEVDHLRAELADQAANAALRQAVTELLADLRGPHATLNGRQFTVPAERVERLREAIACHRR